MKKLGMILSLFAFCFLVGYGVSVTTSKEHALNAANQRDPAAIRNVFDFSTLSGTDLTTAIKKRLLAGAAVVQYDEGLGIELGHFAMEGITGGKALACTEYQKVILGFSAEGMASSGEKPTMEVEGKCEFSSDLTKINPILIPVEKVLHETVSDGELQFRDGTPVTLRFHGMTDEWPRQWLLTSVKLANASGTREVIISSDEVKAMLSQPMVVNFK